MSEVEQKTDVTTCT